MHYYNVLATRDAIQLMPIPRIGFGMIVTKLIAKLDKVSVCKPPYHPILKRTQIIEGVMDWPLIFRGK